jgi:[acyl-carrier-protein] S-malonyltransferase
MFPGQGAQHVGMATKEASSDDSSANVGALYEAASEILKFDLLRVSSEGPKDSLDSTAVCQPAIFVASMAALHRLRERDPALVASATACMGLSLGEYSALCFAGAFSFEDGVRLTMARGAAMQAASELQPSGMLGVVGLSLPEIQALLRATNNSQCTEGEEEQIWIANYLSDSNYALAGSAAACKTAQQLAKAPPSGAGWKKTRLAMPLAVAGAFHTRYMESAIEPLREALRSTYMLPPRLPVLCNVDAAPHSMLASETDSIRAKLLAQLTHPVQWESTMTHMLNAPEFGKAYEIGPGAVCKGVIKRMGAGKGHEVESVSLTSSS